MAELLTFFCVNIIGEAHDQRRAAAALAKLQTLFWKSEASFPFKKYLMRLNEAFMEMEEAKQPLHPAQKVNWLLMGIKNDDIQVQTTCGIIRDRYLTNFDEACLTLSRTISSRFRAWSQVRINEALVLLIQTVTVVLLVGGDVADTATVVATIMAKVQR
jgi:hypothetical protein